jgi:hypothetical protein
VKPRVPWWRWAMWWAILVPALFVFYVLFLPAWLGIRALRWLAHLHSR